MSTRRYNPLTLGDLTVPVPCWAKYMAFDTNGECWVYDKKPVWEEDLKYWDNGSDGRAEEFLGIDFGFAWSWRASPPEEGYPCQQLYRLEWSYE